MLVDSEDSLYLPTLIDYVHLNPVRAGLVTVGEGLEAFPWSSLTTSYMLPRPQRKGWLHAERGLFALGFLDDVMGRRRYLEHLEKRAREEGAEAGRGLPGEQSLQSTLRRGWFFGSQSFKDKMLRMAEEVLAPGKEQSNARSAHEVRDHSTTRALELIAVGMRVCALTEEMLVSLPLGDERKVLIALAVKRETTVSLTWIAEQLRMGTRSTVSRATTTMGKVLDSMPDQLLLNESIVGERKLNH